MIRCFSTTKSSMRILHDKLQRLKNQNVIKKTLLPPPQHTVTKKTLHPPLFSGSSFFQAKILVPPPTDSIFGSSYHPPPPSPPFSGSSPLSGKNSSTPKWLNFWKFLPPPLPPPVSPTSFNKGGFQYEDTTTLWLVRSLWATFSMSEVSGRWFSNCLLLISEDQTQALLILLPQIGVIWNWSHIYNNDG